MKLCKTCRKTKKESEFYKNKDTKDGLWSECKQCNINRTIEWQRKHHDWKLKLQKENWYRNREKYIAKSKECWAKRDFGGMRNVILERDGYRCVKCGMTREEHLTRWGTDINVDHKNRDRKDNTLDNLQTVCLFCHGKKDNGGLRISEWSKKLTKEQKKRMAEKTSLTLKRRYIEKGAWGFLR